MLRLSLFSLELGQGSLLWADVLQYTIHTIHNRSVKTAERCRLSLACMPNLLSCLDESQAGNSHQAHSLAQ